MKGESLSKPTVSELLDRERRGAGTVIQPGQDNTQPDVQSGLGGGTLRIRREGSIISTRWLGGN